VFNPRDVRLVRDEWVNIGMLLEVVKGSRIAMRLIERRAKIHTNRFAAPGHSAGEGAGVHG
jgi:hypothetical protein